MNVSYSDRYVLQFSNLVALALFYNHEYDSFCLKSNIVKYRYNKWFTFIYLFHYAIYYNLVWICLSVVEVFIKEQS